MTIDTNQALQIAKEQFEALENEHGADIDVEEFDLGWIVKYNLPETFDLVGVGQMIIDREGNKHQYSSSYSPKRAIADFTAKQSDKQ